MRVITNKNVQFLSLRVSQIPGLQPEAVVFLNKAIAREDIGITSDKKVFLAAVPTSPATLTKVCICMLGNIEVHIYFLALKYQKPVKY